MMKDSFVLLATIRAIPAASSNMTLVGTRKACAPQFKRYTLKNMFENLLDRMSEWQHLGQKSDQNGSRIIGHIPRDYPEAYLHGYYAPKSKYDWESYDLKLSQSLEPLYRFCNGLSLFLDCLSIFGIRSHYNRDLSAQFQPFDLKSHDKEHREIWHRLPKANTDTRVFFGSYSWDGSGIYATFDDFKIYRVKRDDYKPSNTWIDIETFRSRLGINSLIASSIRLAYILKYCLRGIPSGGTAGGIICPMYIQIFGRLNFKAAPSVPFVGLNPTGSTGALPR